MEQNCFGAHCFGARWLLEQNCFGVQSFEVRSLSSIWVGSTRLYSGLPPNLLWCWLLYIGKLVKLVLWIQCALYLPSCIVINDLMQIMPCAQSNFRNKHSCKYKSKHSFEIFMREYFAWNSWLGCKTFRVAVDYHTSSEKWNRATFSNNHNINTFDKNYFLLTVDILDIPGCTYFLISTKIVHTLRDLYLECWNFWIHSFKLNIKERMQTLSSSLNLL